MADVPDASTPDDPRRQAPAAERNREPILSVLRDRLPARGTVLEVASGTGQHGVFFADALPRLLWQPSDRDPAMLDSIAAWTQHPGFRAGPVPNLLPPLLLDLADPAWARHASSAVRFAVAVVAINLLHVAPWSIAERLFQGSAALLMPGRHLFVYGPFTVGGKHTSRGNASFDRSLKRENGEWGLRDVDALRDLAEANRFDLEEVVEMPANNLLLMFVRG